MAVLIAAIALLCSFAFGQGFGSLQGTVLDPGGAAVPNAKVVIKNLATGATRDTVSNGEGIFVINSVIPATYDLMVTATAGFKAYSSKSISITAAEKRDLGSINLTLGSVAEEISVTAAATPIQTASSEGSKLVDSTQMANITMKGRDLFGILQTIPGISFGNNLLSGNGDATSNASGTYGAMTINGGGTARTNFTVDGVIAMDNGNNSQLDFEPTTDTIAEIRVLTSGYQAEYGHSSSGQISVITKGGSQEFHGSANVNKRHEMWNAHTFSQNYSGTKDKTKYRYFISTYTIGGPVFIPKLFNTQKKKLFFFWSQEYTKQKPTSNSTVTATVPTAAQLAGNFNDRCTISGVTLDSIGVPTTCTPAYTTGNGTNANISSNFLIDPTAASDRSKSLTTGNLNDLVGKSVGGVNVYSPTSAAMGLAFLKDMPAPNMCTPAAGIAANGQAISPTNCPAGYRTDLPYTLSANSGWLYGANYTYGYTQSHPRRNDTARIDWNISSRLNSYIRWTRDTDKSNQNYGLPIKTGDGSYNPFSLMFALPGHGLAVGATYTISPTMVNEFTFGKIWNGVGWYATDESQLLSSSVTKSTIPGFYDLTKDANVTAAGNFGKRWMMDTTGYQNWGPYVPTLGFGARNGRGENAPSSGCGWGICPYTNWAESWTFQDNVSKVQGKHNLKAGLYVERTAKDQQGRTGNYNGSWSFGDSGNMPMSTGDGYANAWLGNFNTFQQGYGNFSEWWFSQVEFFAQDSFRVNRRLTLDIGARFYYMPPITNMSTGLNSSSEFVPQLYNKANQMRVYEPGCAILTAGVPTGVYDTSAGACPNNGTTTKTMAWDRAQGANGFAPVWLQNTFVPASAGGYASGSKPVNESGMTQCGSDPLLPHGCYTPPKISPSLRFGFAWDVFGNGKTAVRGSIGQFLNRLSYNQIAGANSYSLPLAKTTYYGSIMDVQSSAVQASATSGPRGTIGVGFNGFQQNEATYNGSFGVQQSLGFSTVLEATYVFNLRRHTPYTMNRNYYPLFSQYENAATWGDPMSKYLQSPTVTGYPSIANNGMGRVSDRFVYQQAGVCPTCVPGYDNIVTEAFQETGNYHSLQLNLRRNMTKHLSFGSSFTWGKVMAPAGASLFNSDPGFSRSQVFAQKYRNWGPSYQPTPQFASFNFVYEPPNLAQKLNFKPLGIITDHWTASGLGQWRSNAMTGVPGFGFSNTSGSCTTPANPSAGSWSSCYPQWNWTGSSEGARVNVVGDYHLSSIGKTWSYDAAYPTNTSTAIAVATASPALSPTLAYDPLSTGDNYATNPAAWATPMPCSKGAAGTLGISPFTGAGDPHYGTGENMACFGNAGPGSLVNVPGTRVNNWDLTMTKNFPLKNEKRNLTFRMEMYNVMNHPNFTVGNGAANSTYDWRNWLQGRNINTNVNLNRLGSPLNPRQMSMTLRLVF